MGTVTLEIRTDLLFGKYQGWHRIGHFLIVANLTSKRMSDIRFTNLDGQIKCGHAGTVRNETGQVTCFGNATEAISNALENHDDLALVDILVRFVECPGQYTKLSEWPLAATSEVPQWYIETFGP